MAMLGGSLLARVIGWGPVDPALNTSIIYERSESRAHVHGFLRSGLRAHVHGFLCSVVVCLYDDKKSALRDPGKAHISVGNALRGAGVNRRTTSFPAIGTPRRAFPTESRRHPRCVGSCEP